MKILYLTELLSSIGGGGESAFYSLAKAISTNHDVYVLCHASRNDQSQLATANRRLTIHPIQPALELRHGFFPTNAQQARYVIRLILHGSKIIQDQNIDLIHANTLSPAIAASLLGAMYRKPVITTFHHIDSPKANARLRPCLSVSEKITIITRALFDKSILHLPFSCIHAISYSTEKAIRESGYRGRIEVVPNGLDFNLYQRLPNGIEYEPYLLFIGRLVRSKNLGIVIEAFAKTLEIKPNARLVVIGDGPMKKEWQEQAIGLGIEHRIEFKGYVSEQEKIDLISRCSALVFPSLIEGFGIVILEAFALAKPVIASWIDSSSELITNGKDGFLLPPFEPMIWTKIMTNLLLNPAICERMGSEGQMRARKRYQLSDISEKMDLVYHQLSKHCELTIRP